MRITAVSLTFLASLATAWLAGCGGGTGDKPAARIKKADVKGEAAKAEIKQYDIADLLPVDEPLQRPLDGGRLEICPPADWGFFSQANYLVVFAKGKVSDLPRMTVAAIVSPYGTADTTEDNAQALAKNIRRRLEKDKKIVRENPKPVILAGRVWVRHVRQVSQGGSPCAVQSLQTVRGGRLYTLEMFSAAKDDSPASIAAAVTANKVRDIAYSVAANVRFTAESPASPTPSEEKASEKASETKPAEAPAGETKPVAPAPTEKPAEPKPDENKTG